ncbi:hypothetical protein TVAG_445250 [Trichomonas vaginalis G3]|uniref:Uncharacterized protein n=1 Tax=Trichomonas vaginalis (strain ATCC PRA-98 / G3) TaxID=412133 RepID=A2E4J1_TRIV3|nr:EGF domain-specific O-linked N-acetylglucosamine family [Trichomonas vaginalis G3]EAY12413.1 hypothetical protein TVAG_445250 [Trichomonas vaginalis G3]KAI5494176.1 EGF domain-specific O-linked N-acetylglucosamine family [Trichomonas vaginalis G3]|eukprot:XP_001324636.1 hypothetical protein [Trichomonas vaginalis G3]
MQWSGCEENLVSPPVFCYHKMIKLHKRVSFFKRHKIHLIIFAAILSSILLAFISYYESKFPTNIRGFHPCYSIKSIQSQNNTIKISYHENIPIKFYPYLKDYYGFETYAFDQLLIFPNYATNQDYLGEDKLFLSIDLPFIQDYDGKLYCKTPDFNQKPSLLHLKSNIPESENDFDVKLSKIEFSKSNYSQAKCFGSSFETRYCEFRNTALLNGFLVFFSKAKYNFPHPFMTIDGRSPPFSSVSAALDQEPVVLNSSVQEFNENFEIIEKDSILISLFNDSTSLWNTLTSLSLPFISSYETLKITKDILIFIRNAESSNEIVSVLSDNKIRHLQKYPKEKYLFKRLIVGYPTFEEDPSYSRNPDEENRVVFNFNRSFIDKFKNQIFEKYKIPKPDRKDGLLDIVLLNSSNNNSSILNLDDIEQYIRTSCDFCNLHRVDFKNLDLTQRINLSISSNIFIGAESDEIANSFWMISEEKKKKPVIIELQPFGMTCSRIAKEISKFCDFEYFNLQGVKLEALNISSSKAAQLNSCQNNAELCYTNNCYKLLYQQDIKVEISEFAAVFDQIIKEFYDNSIEY